MGQPCVHTGTGVVDGSLIPLVNSHHMQRLAVLLALAEHPERLVCEAG